MLVDLWVINSTTNQSTNSQYQDRQFLPVKPIHRRYDVINVAIDDDTINTVSVYSWQLGNYERFGFVSRGQNPQYENLENLVESGSPPTANHFVLGHMANGSKNSVEISSCVFE